MTPSVMAKARNNRLITEFFQSAEKTTKTRSRRLTAKDLALEQESLKRKFVSLNCDPPDFLVDEIEGKGKGVVSLVSIPQGNFICEYAGDLIEMEEAKVTLGFLLGCLF